MDVSFLNLLALAFLGSVAGLVGGVIFLFNSSWARSLAKYAVPFAAGVLLAVSFLDLLPEAVEVAGKSAFPLILVVFICLFLIERFLFHLHHHGGEHAMDKRDMVPLVIFGDTIHNLLDGVAIGAAYLANPVLGVTVALATFFHETPHEIADFGLLLSAGWKRKKAFFVNFLSALATFPGAILTYKYSGEVDSATGILLSLAAGFFLYVAATDFLPETKIAPEDSSLKNIAFLILGVLVIWLLGLLLPHG
ncbi:MAG: ZIP family metal transporter [Patescibacteria group bacterium]